MKHSEDHKNIVGRIRGFVNKKFSYKAFQWWICNFAHLRDIEFEDQDFCFVNQCGLKYVITRARGYKTFFMLNSAEHEILNARKYKNIKKLSIFSGSEKPRVLFFPAQKC